LSSKVLYENPRQLQDFFNFFFFWLQSFRRMGNCLSSKAVYEPAPTAANFTQPQQVATLPAPDKEGIDRADAAS
jgi:hypothetical protein